MRTGLTLISIFFLLFFTVFLPSGTLTAPNPNEVQIPDEIPCEIPNENQQPQVCLVKEQVNKLSAIFWSEDLPHSWPARVELVAQFVPLDLQRPPSHC
jgi:hypothetical protein